MISPMIVNYAFSDPTEFSVRTAAFRTGKRWCGGVQEASGNEGHSQAEVGTVCVLPLVSRDRVLGVFGVAQYQDNAFTGDDMEFLTQTANQVAIAVQNAFAYGHIRELKASSRRKGSISKKSLAK
jgi:formate hydrogenlyase transcriptional activator